MTCSTRALWFAGAVAVAASGLGSTPIVSPDPEFTVIKDEAMPAGQVRVSRLLDATVYDAAGKDVGHIKDVALDLNEYAVPYIALSHGFGFFQRKTLALPFAAMAFTPSDAVKVCVQANGKTLDQAQGFDVAKGWPVVADQSFYATTDPILKEALDRAQMSDDYDVAMLAAAQLNPEHAATWTERASQWFNREVRSGNGDRIGKIEDIVIDQKTGRVSYVCIELDASVNSDRPYIAMPMTAIHSSPDSDKLVLNIGTSDVKAMPGFEAKHWPASAKPAGAEDVSANQ